MSLENNVIFLDLEMKSMLSLMKIHPFFFRRGNQFFFKSKDKETFSSLFLFIMSCAYIVVLHIKVYGHFSLVLII